MENKAIAKAFKLCSQLMELFNENPFRTKAMASASFKIDKLPFPAVDASLQQLSEQPGIGKSTADRIQTIIETGSFTELDILIRKTPQGILEMLSIKGLGPKKIQIIWQELGIESVGELLYACNENRLVAAKGFGLKTQEEIRKAIEFTNSNQGLFLYAKTEQMAHELLAAMISAFPVDRHEITGEFRRKCEVISSVDILTTSPIFMLHDWINLQKIFTVLEIFDASLLISNELGVRFQIIYSNVEEFTNNLLVTTGSELHLQQLKLIQPNIPMLPDEEGIYQALGLQYIEPELREGGDEVSWAKRGTSPSLINYHDLRGALHNHSTYSDGVHSLEQMATYCKDNLALEYFGICDHSKTAVYANGLSVDRLEQQWQEIDRLNLKFAPFRIFKGIESDILSDGALDYANDILEKFDFVVASVHSNLRMDEDKATHRLIRAIENPYTTILGHPTGRLLLSRAGYPINHKKVIDACAANGVAIEINANPLRLDLDWRWQQYALEQGVMLSINPDAHRMDGLEDMKYGIYMARKGGLTAEKCLNAFSVQRIDAYFKKRKENRF
ncbi:helix-hairpin-helix domain-containing protein [Sphingobacterium suaedae]|uniref:Helix-hairpin-helix domain-containing protein n=1 Tax=Sphingobacterium suaedae TaxID=1686402 RepID=A0ABW5KD03_9SPHI